MRTYRPGLEQHREAMMRHYHYYEDRLHNMTNAPDDYMDDVRYKSLQRHRRKLDALFNAVYKEYDKMKVANPDICATLCLFTNFILVSTYAYRAYIKPLGEAIIKQLPTYAEDAIRRLERSGDAANRMLEAIDIDHIGEGRAATAMMSRISKGLLESIVSVDELNRAASYANKEYKRAEKETVNKK